MLQTSRSTTSISPSAVFFSKLTLLNLRWMSHPNAWAFIATSWGKRLIVFSTTQFSLGEVAFHPITSAMDFLQLAGKPILIFGVANRKSVAWHIGRVLGEAGASASSWCRTTTSARPWPNCSAGRKSTSATLSTKTQIARLRDELAARGEKFHGLVHSMAFADYSEGLKPFHETPKKAFLQAVDVSCFSLIALCNAMKDLLDPDASVVTLSISTTQMASESYGYMAPIKAALDRRWPFWPSRSAVLAGAVQRRGPGVAEDFGLGGHPGLRRRLSLRRAGDPAQEGGADRRGGPRGGLPAEPPLQRHQRPADRGRRRHVDQLLRPGTDAAAGGAMRSPSPDQPSVGARRGLGEGDLWVASLRAFSVAGGGRRPIRREGRNRAWSPAAASRSSPDRWKEDAAHRIGAAGELLSRTPSKPTMVATRIPSDRAQSRAASYRRVDDRGPTGTSLSLSTSGLKTM